MSDHDGCIRQIAGLRAEVERLKEEIEALTHEGRQGELEQANVGLAERVRILTEALEWYADPDKYCSQSGDDPENWYLATVYGFGVIADKAKSALAASNHKAAIPENCDQKTEA